MLKYRTKYWIHDLSMSTFHIRKHFRGKVKNFNADQERKDDWCIEKSEASTRIHRLLGRNAQTNQKQAFSSLLTASKSSMITWSEHHGVRFDFRDKSLSLPSPVPMSTNSMTLANDCWKDFGKTMQSEMSSLLHHAMMIHRLNKYSFISLFLSLSNQMN